MKTHCGTRTYKVPYNDKIIEAKVKWHSRPTGVQIDAVTSADGMRALTLEGHVIDGIKANIEADLKRQERLVRAS